MATCCWACGCASSLDDAWETSCCPDDPAAIEAAPLFEEMFADYETKLHEVKTLDELDAVIADVIIWSSTRNVSRPKCWRKGKKLKLIQHLGLDYRGVPMDAARELGVPVCATPLINYIAVAEHAWALLLNHYKQMLEQRRQMEQRLYVERGWGATVPNVRICAGLYAGLAGLR